MQILLLALHDILNTISRIRERTSPIFYSRSRMPRGYMWKNTCCLRINDSRQMILVSSIITGSANLSQVYHKHHICPKYILNSSKFNNISVRKINFSFEHTMMAKYFFICRIQDISKVLTQKAHNIFVSLELSNEKT